MSSRKYDLPTVCLQCREVVYSVTTRCDECRAWSIDTMTKYLRHKKSLATKSKKKPVTSASLSLSALPLCLLLFFLLPLRVSLRDFRSLHLFLHLLLLLASPASEVPSFSAPLSFPSAPLGVRLPSASAPNSFPDLAAPSSSSAPLPGFLPRPPPLALFPPAAPPSGFFPSAPAVPPPSSLWDPAVVPGLGVGVSSSFGVPSFDFLASASSAPLSGHPPPGFPPAAPGFSVDLPPPSFSAPFALDPFSDSEDRNSDDDRQCDPSASSLPSDSSRSEYCRMIEYVLGLFPQAAGVPPTAPPPCALFESFFATASPSLTSLQLN